MGKKERERETLLNVMAIALQIYLCTSHFCFHIIFWVIVFVQYLVGWIFIVVRAGFIATERHVFVNTSYSNTPEGRG